jgi:hypothetical protein
VKIKEACLLNENKHTQGFAQTNYFETKKAITLMFKSVSKVKIISIVLIELCFYK